MGKAVRLSAFLALTTAITLGIFVISSVYLVHTGIRLPWTSEKIEDGKAHYSVDAFTALAISIIAAISLTAVTERFAKSGGLRVFYISFSLILLLFAAVMLTLFVNTCSLCSESCSVRECGVEIALFNAEISCLCQ